MRKTVLQIRDHHYIEKWGDNAPRMGIIPFDLILKSLKNYKKTRIHSNIRTYCLKKIHINKIVYELRKKFGIKKRIKYDPTIHTYLKLVWSRPRYFD